MGVYIKRIMALGLLTVALMGCGKEYWCPETREFYFCPNCGADCRGKQDED